MQKLLLFACGLACTVFLVWHTMLMQRAATVMEEGFRPLGVREALSHPGPIYLENDSYYWLYMAETMRDSGVWRIRHTPADNAPDGRPVYWSQSIAWLIAGLASLPVFAGAASPEGAASLWVNPLLHVATVWVLLALLQAWGWRVACTAALLFVALGDLLWAFSPLRPDHQSLQVAFLAVVLAALVREGFGFGRPRMDGGEAGVRRWPFVVAGVAAGAGLWVSAAVMMPIFTMLAVAVCLAGFTLGIGTPEGARVARQGWFLWGGTAGAVSLAFWLVEFFPELGRTRLEVNNPAFSLWVAGLGLGMGLAMGPRLADASSVVRRFVPVALVGGLCALLPATIMFGPVAWYWPRYEVMDRLHNFIMEFYTFQNFTKGKILPSVWNMFQMVLPMALLLAFLGFGRSQRALRPTAWIMSALLVGLIAISMGQIRWVSLLTVVVALSAGLGAGCLAEIVRARFRRWGGLAATAIVVAVAVQAVVLAGVQVRTPQKVVAGKALLNEVVQFVLNKQFALALAEREDKPTVVMADPNIVPALWYFARIPGIISLYWENIEGARDATGFFADSGSEEAAAVARRRGLSHVIVPSGPLFANYYDFIRHGHYNTQRASQTFGARLAEGSPLSLPDWIQLDEPLDRIGKTPFVYRGERIEQYLNVYRIVWPTENEEEPATSPSDS